MTEQPSTPFRLAMQDFQQRLAAMCDLPALAEQLVAIHEHAIGQASFSTFSDLRVRLVPVVTAYRCRKWQPTSETTERIAGIFMLDDDGKVLPDSVHRSVDQILEEPIAFGTCDDCMDPTYHDQLVHVANEKLCPKCKQEHEDAAVHSDSSET